MSRWLKIGAGLLGGMLLLALGAAVWLQGRIGPELRDRLNRDLPGRLGIPFSVGEIRVNFLTGRAEVRDLVLGNPPGFQQPHLFRTRRFAADFSTFSFLRGEPRIGDILIQGPDMVWETRGEAGSNWATLLRAGGRSRAGSGRGPGRGEEPRERGGAGGLELERIRIENAVLQFAGTNRAVTVPPVRLPSFEFNRPGHADGDSGFTMLLKFTGALAVGMQEAGVAWSNAPPVRVEPAP